MKRLLAWATAALVFSGGCNQCRPLTDPFFGNTQVPPPGTGSISGQAVDPYYQPAPAGTAPSTFAPGVVPSNGAPSYSGAAAGGYGAPGATTAPLSGSPITPATPYSGTTVPNAGAASSGGYSPPSSANNNYTAPYQTPGTYTNPTRPSSPQYTPPQNTAPQNTAPQNVTPQYTPPQYTPPGGTFNFRNGANSGASTAPASGSVATLTPTPAGTQLAARDLGAATLAGRQRVVRVIQPRAAVASSSPTSSATQQGAVPTPASRQPLQTGQPIDISELPQPQRATATRGAQSGPRQDSGFRLVSAEEDDSATGQVKPAVATTTVSASSSRTARYSRADDYSWLHGRLEYSQTQQQWKLRYIPIDGDTDNYGGSVVLSDPKLLSGYERGDFVEVCGHIGKREASSNFAPPYDVVEIRRLAR